MPELPEVETIRRGLVKFCVHEKIEEVQVLCAKSFIGPKEVVEEHEVLGLRRYGKALIVDLSGGISMMVHLRMTGQLVWDNTSDKKVLQQESLGVAFGAENSGLISASVEKCTHAFAGGHPSDTFFDELPNKQTRVVIKMNDGTLYFNDQRKFGFIKVMPTAEVEQDKFIASLAPEPWKCDAEKIYQVFQRKKNSPIKAVILDQKVIAGIGNIYADEALFYAGIHPERKAGSLSLNEVKKLLEGACKSMDASINAGGSTMATYVRADGTKGDYLEKFAQVFRREGQPCYKCGVEIIKIRVAGRGTHICPNCQRLVA